MNKGLAISLIGMVGLGREERVATNLIGIVVLVVNKGLATS